VSTLTLQVFRECGHPDSWHLDPESGHCDGLVWVGAIEETTFASIQAQQRLADGLAAAVDYATELRIELEALRARVSELEATL
jgi:hypothetical protein